MLRPRFELGLFDPLESVKAAQVPDAELDSPAHRELALKLARESLVLLKNDGVLPFAKAPARIAVVGPLADNAACCWATTTAAPSRSTTALAGIQKQFAKAKVVFEPGTTYLRPDVAGADVGADDRHRHSRASRPRSSRRPTSAARRSRRAPTRRSLVGRNRGDGPPPDFSAATHAAAREADALDRAS